MAARITAVGAYMPERELTNDDLAQELDTSDEWVRTRTGIECRRVAVGESTSHMAVKAARDALAHSSCTAKELQFLIVCTCTPDHLMPSMSCLVQQALGADGALCFDLNAACSGFLYGLNVAKGYIESGMYSRGMVIGADVFSKILNWNDRSTCVLFGDGAGAVIVEQGKQGIRSMVMGADGNGGNLLYCKSSSILEDEEEKRKQQDFVCMDGQEIFRFAVRQVPFVIREVLDKEKLSPSQIDWYILHQANQRIITAVMKKLGEPAEKFPMNLNRYGNTASASIPVLLCEMERAGRLQTGQRLVLAGFGAGLTWGAAVAEW